MLLERHKNTYTVAWGAACTGLAPSGVLAHGSQPAVASHSKHSCFPILLPNLPVVPASVPLTVAIWCWCVHSVWVCTVQQECLHQWAA